MGINRWATGGHSMHIATHVSHSMAQMIVVEDAPPIRIEKVRFHLGSFSQMDTSTGSNESSIPSDVDVQLRLRITEPDENGKPGGRDLLHEQLINTVKPKRGNITFDLTDFEVYSDNHTFFVILDLIVDDIENYHGVFPLFSIVNKGEHPFLRQFGCQADWRNIRLGQWHERLGNRHELGYDIWYEY